MMKKNYTFLIVLLIILISDLTLAQDVRIIPPVGHTGQITDVDMSADGRYIVSSSVDKTIILWDYITGRQIIKFSGTDYGATCCVFDDKHKIIYSAGWDGKIREWDLKELKQTAEWQAYSNGVNNIDLLPKSRNIVSIGKDGILKIWKAKNGTLIKEMKISDYACDAIATSEKNNLLAIGDQGGNLILIDTKSLEIIQKIKLHDSFITSLSFSKNGKILASGSYDYKIKVVDTEDFNILYDFNEDYQMWTEVSVSPEAEKMTALSMNGFLYEWNLETGEKIYKKTTGFQMGTALVYNIDASEIIACGASNKISVFRSLQGVEIKSFANYTSPVEGIDVIDENLLIGSASWDSRLRLFDMYKCRLSNSIFIDNQILTDLFISRAKNDTYISSMGWKIHNLKIKEDILSEYIDAGTSVNSLSLSDNENYLAIAGNDSLIKVYETDNTSPIFKVQHRDNVMDVCFNHKGDFVFSVGRDSILNITNVFDPDENYNIKLKSKAESVAVTSDDKFLAVGLWTGDIAICNIEKKLVVKYIKPHNWIVSALEFSPVNDYILSASWDKNLVLTDWENEIEAARYTGHTGSITSVKYNPDGKYVISGGWDSQIKILDSRALEEICTIIPVDEEDYLILTPEMYYMGTSDAAKKVSFADGLHTYSFEQFDLQYNRPDKVIESLPFADKQLIPLYKKAHEKRMLKIGFNGDFFDKTFNAPEVEIKNFKKIDFYTSKNTVDIDILASDSIYHIDRYNIFVNGVSVFGSNGKNTRKDNKNEITIREKINLSEGMNYIEVSAMNTQGIESLRKSVEVYYSPETEIQRNLYVISMAVAEYDNTDYNLNYTINDGRAIVNTFKELEPEYNVIIDTLFGKDCTRDNFNSLKEKLNNTNVDDIVIIHFSGHGLLDSEGDFYFATYDVDFSNPSVNGLEYDLIEGVMDGIPARNKLVLLDACHSGELDEEIQLETNERTDVSETAQQALAAKGVVMYNVPTVGDNDILDNSFDLMMNYFADVRKGTGAVVISAATGSGFALEISKLKHGVFTYVLLKALHDKLADANQDGEITVSELREYIFENVVEISEGYQKPTTRKDNLMNNFVIYR